MKVLTEQDEQALSLIIDALGQINNIANAPHWVSERRWRIERISGDALKLAKNLGNGEYLVNVSFIPKGG